MVTFYPDYTAKKAMVKAELFVLSRLRISAKQKELRRKAIGRSYCLWVRDIRSACSGLIV